MTVDKKKILETLKIYFSYSGSEHIDNDGLVSITGNCELVDLSITKLPVQFDNIDMSFDCSHSNIETLNGAPNYVGETFYCSSCKLNTLVGAPTYVKKNFDCNSNNLISLDGCPSIIRGTFNCSYNNLTSLVGGPEYVNGHYYCFNNRLKNLSGLPKNLNGYRFYITVYPNIPLLKLLNIENAEYQFFDEDGEIINELVDLFKEHYGKGAKGQLQCGIEMIRLG